MSTVKWGGVQPNPRDGSIPPSSAFAHTIDERLDMTTQHGHLVCCYCDRELALEAKSCYCGEYKGVMTVEAFEEYLNVKFDCYCLEDE